MNDADTGLTYMQQRYYDPVAGRFLSIDPVTTDVQSGASFNRYAYAENNPYRYVDPDGRFSRQTCADMVGNCENLGGTSSRSEQIGPSPTGAVIGAGIGGAVAVACDGLTAGICAVGNPAMVGAGAFLGSVTPAAIQKAQQQLEKLLNKNDTGTPNEFQYALVANSAGNYPNVRGGTTYLERGEVWKYGTTYDLEGRYSVTKLAALNVSMQIQSRGSLISTLIAEKTQLIFYAITHGALPPGNSRFK